MALVGILFALLATYVLFLIAKSVGSRSLTFVFRVDGFKCLSHKIDKFLLYSYILSNFFFQPQRQTLGTLETLGTLRTLRTLGILRNLGSLETLGTLRTLVTLRTLRTGSDKVRQDQTG